MSILMPSSVATRLASCVGASLRSSVCCSCRVPGGSGPKLNCMALATNCAAMTSKAFSPMPASGSPGDRSTLVRGFLCQGFLILAFLAQPLQDPLAGRHARLLDVQECHAANKDQQAGAHSHQGQEGPWIATVEVQYRR